MKGIDRVRRRVPQSVLTAAVLTLALATATIVAADGRNALKGPLVIKEQGSFSIDGDSVLVEHTSGDPSDPFNDLLIPGHITVNDMYVEYQIPKDASRHVPVVMLHGGDLSGASYETTPDGRMGWEEYFVRRDRAVYVPDQVGRARSGVDLRAIIEVRLGLRPVSDLPTLFIGTDELIWPLFRLGPEFGTPFPNTKFPVGAFAEFSKQIVPDFNADLPEPNPTIVHLATLAADLRGAILIGHSESGLFPVEAALTDPDGVKGAILTEPGGGCNSSGYTDQQIDALTTIPILAVFGDITLNPIWQSTFDDCNAFVQRINDAGGDARMLHTAELGIFGNSHMLMLDKNNLQIADLILKWIDRHVDSKN